MPMKHQNKILWIFSLTAATALSAIGVHFFRLPNHFLTGGAASIGILLSQLIPGISAGTCTAVLNLFFVLTGFLVLGKSFGRQCIYCSLLFSVLLQLFELWYPISAPLTDEKMLELLFACLLPAISSAWLIYLGSSTGGTETIALILRKFTVLDVGKALLCVDILFTASTFFLFDLQTALYSCLGLFIKTALIDTFLEEIQRKKALFIVTEEADPVLDHITGQLHRSATFWEVQGAYTKDKRWVILTVVNPSQSKQLRIFLRQTDPNAFILSENSSEIYGKGFTHN